MVKWHKNRYDEVTLQKIWFIDINVEQTRFRYFRVIENNDKVCSYGTTLVNDAVPTVCGWTNFMAMSTANTKCSFY